MHDHGDSFPWRSPVFLKPEQGFEIDNIFQKNVNVLLHSVPEGYIKPETFLF